MKLRKRLATLLAATLALSPAMADEGMWLLPFLKQQNSKQLKKAGLLIDVDDIYNPDSTSMKDAVVIFGGGCTGEIISSEGLILTNHHCGYDAIQQHSTVEHDYLTDGFWAMSKKEELPTPGLQVRFIEKIVEVTDSIDKAVRRVGRRDERLQRPLPQQASPQTGRRGIPGRKPLHREWLSSRSTAATATSCLPSPSTTTCAW